MHNLFLGELRHHCIKIWGLKTAKDRGKPRRTVAHDQQRQDKELRRIRNGVEKMSVDSIARVRRDYIVAVAQYNNIPVASPDGTKAHYAKAMLEWVQTVAGGLAAFQLPLSQPHPTKEFKLTPDESDDTADTVLDSAVLGVLREDIRDVVLPSWLDKPPSNIGEKGHGKLKADHWRTLCTVIMPITLVRLWAIHTALPAQAEALTNFMHLIAAVDLATRRSMSVDRAHLFDRHMEAYIQGLRAIYHATLVPNHHLSLHLRECLLLFGPTHGWWAFPFERYNGLLQRLKTNQRPSDMPGTFIRYFYVGAALRWIMDTFKWPEFPEYQEMVEAFRGAFSTRYKGAQSMDILTSLSDTDSDPPQQRKTLGTKTLSDDVYKKLLALVNQHSTRTFASIHDGVIGGDDFLSDTAELARTIEHAGVTFSTAGRGKRNSFILFSTSIDGRRTVIAGQIVQIFHHVRRIVTSETDASGTFQEEPFLVVKAFKQLSNDHTQYDPYLKFPDVPTWLCYNELDSEEFLVRPQDIVSHFAALIYTPTEIRRECIVVRSLDRVCVCYTLDR
ncbi:hypothetical protein C8Q80DRAFT_1219846 [Daedaleopsis nitida]|nr:hypothetical protein C8Q80DRAFT_1219846 [Daedaleopsis nitida]